MATKSIGFVAELTGDAQVRSVDGVIRVLSLGDEVHEGDLLVTGLETRIVIQFYDGAKLQVGADSEVLLDETVFAGLKAFADDEVDRLLELKGLTVAEIDVAELEVPQDGARFETNALGQASDYMRDGDQGSVDTRRMPFGIGDSDPQVDSPFDDDRASLLTDSGDSGGGSSGGTSPVTPSTAWVNVDPVTADDTINAAESGGMVNVTGTVGGGATPGSAVSFTVNGTPYNGVVGAGNTFSIPVAGADLMTTTGFTVTVSGTDVAGDPYTANATTSYTVDLNAAATIAVDPITADDFISAAEAAGTVDVTGTVGGDASPGDPVTFTVNGTNYNGTVGAGNSFSITVSGADLAADNSFDVTVSGTDTAGNPFTATTTSTHTVNDAPVAVDDAITTAEDTPFVSVVDLDANDTDLNGDALTVVPGTFATAMGGSITIAADGSYTYTPGC